MPTRSAVILVGLLLLARPVGAQVATPRDLLKELGSIGVDHQADAQSECRATRLDERVRPDSGQVSRRAAQRVYAR